MKNLGIIIIIVLFFSVTYRVSAQEKEQTDLTPTLEQTTPIPTEEISPTAIPTEVVTPTPRISNKPTPKPTVSKKPTPTSYPTETPQPTITPMPTATPISSPTPTPIGGGGSINKIKSIFQPAPDSSSFIPINPHEITPQNFYGNTFTAFLWSITVLYIGLIFLYAGSRLVGMEEKLLQYISKMKQRVRYFGPLGALRVRKEII